MYRILLATAALSLLAATAAPDTAIAGPRQDNLWIHVAVDGSPEDDERVRVNLPLSFLQTVLPLIDEDEFHHGKIHLHDEDLDQEDIVAILRAVSDAEDGEYVTVEDGSEHVRVAKRGDEIRVRVEEFDDRRSRHGGRSERVDITIPVEVLEALVSSGDDELDVVAALRALGEHTSGDLVTVNEEDGSTVRIWIDDSNESEGNSRRRGR